MENARTRLVRTSTNLYSSTNQEITTTSSTVSGQAMVGGDTSGGVATIGGGVSVGGVGGPIIGGMLVGSRTQSQTGSQRLSFRGVGGRTSVTTGGGGVSYVCVCDICISSFTPHHVHYHYMVIITLLSLHCYHYHYYLYIIIIIIKLCLYHTTSYNHTTNPTFPHTINTPRITKYTYSPPIHHTPHTYTFYTIHR